jgi:siroheme synthase (precorrin-2 oxidase/ferrochelatase)
MIIAWTRYSRRSSDHFVRDQHAELDFYSANSMKQQFAGRDIAPLEYIILIPSANQFLTLNAVWLAEKQRILIL